MIPATVIIPLVSAALKDLVPAIAEAFAKARTSELDELEREAAETEIRDRLVREWAINHQLHWSIR